MLILLLAALVVGSHAGQRNWDHKEALRGHTRRVSLHKTVEGSRPLLDRGAQKNTITCPFPTSADTETLTETAASPLPNKWEVIATDAVINGTDYTAPARGRREEACSGFDSIGKHLVDMMESEDGSSRHAFEDADGSLVIQWAGQPNPNMLVNAEIRSLDIFADNSGLHTLYNSKDHGTTFAPAMGPDGNALEPIFDAIYSEVPMDNGYYPAFATPEDGANNYLYMSMDGGANFKKFDVEEHFDYIVPHPKVTDRFLGLDVEENAQSMTVFVCDNVMDAFKSGTSLKDNCIKAHSQVIDAEWIMHDSSIWMNKNFGMYFTQFQGDIEDDQLVLYKWVASMGDYKAKPPTKIMPKGVAKVDHFVQTNDYMFVTDVGDTSDDFSEQNLYVSTDEGATWTTSKFPKSADSKANYFVVVDASEKEVMVAVQHTFTELRGDAKVVLADSDGNPVNGFGGGIDATRAIFSEIITATEQSSAWNADGMTLFRDTDNLLGCPEDGALKPVPQDGKKYAYIMDRGICTFVAKLQNAYGAGASAVIVVNADDTHRVYMSSPEGNLAPNIPEVIVNNTIGQAIYKAMKDAADDGGIQLQLYEENQELNALYQHSNLYMSEGGEQYTVALKDVIYKDSDDWRQPAYVDVVKCSSVNGTYMANIYDEGKETTIITYDKGAFWWSLKLMENGKAKQLHLSMEMYNTLYRMPQPVSTDSATGVILANGWVTDKGEGIPARSELISKAKAVLSEDGGRTWKVVDQEPHDFRILDHGGVLVFVPWNKMVDTVKFSLDEGQTVQSFKFLNNGGDGDLVGTFTDSVKGCGGFGSAAIDCEKSTHMVGNGDDAKYEDRFTCIKGNSLGSKWSPGIVTIDGTKATMHGNDANVYTGTYVDGKVTWTTDDGKDWTWTKKVDDGAPAQTMVQIQGVATEPGGKSLIMMAYYYNFAAKSWVGIKMDFDVLFFTECDEKNDFETWTVKSHSDKECVLGVKQTVTRRKACSFCKNGLDFERTVKTAGDECECSREDYQCNYGYTFTKQGSCEHAYDCPGGTCEPDVDFYRDMCKSANRPSLPHIIKVPVDVCKEGALNDWNLWAQPQPLQCAGQKPATGTTAKPSTNNGNGGKPGPGASTSGGDDDGTTSSKKKSAKGKIIGAVVGLVFCIGIIGAIVTRRQAVSLSISADRYTAVHNEDMPGDDDDVLGGL